MESRKRNDWTIWVKNKCTANPNWSVEKYKQLPTTREHWIKEENSDAEEKSCILLGIFSVGRVNLFYTFDVYEEGCYEK